MKLSHLLIFVISIICVYANKPCIPKYFGPEMMVCVCNSTYCDNIDDVEKLSSGQYLQYTSNKKGLRFQKSAGSFHKTPTSNSVHMVINTSQRYQTILGFGAAFTDSVGININSLSAKTQENLLKSYFSPEGIELNFGRVPIAGCDFSTHTYTYDDIPNDTRLQHFNLTVEDYTLKIPLIKRAFGISKRKIRLIGAAWSAPPWMKTNNDYSGFGFLKDEYYEAWANYHIRFLDEYKKKGVEFWSISTGNEPINGVLPLNRINSLGWTPITQFKWVRENLGPAIKNSQHNNTKIIALDDQRFLLPWWLEPLKTDHLASGFIDGIGVHWYFDDYLPASLLERTHNNFPDKFILATEASLGYKPWDFQKVILGSWPRGELYMEDILEDLSHWVVGWIDWNLALNEEGGPNWANNFVDSAVIVNATADEFYKQPMFYAFGHFTKFVLEGSVRIDIKPQAKNGLQSIAFQTVDSAVVIILYNKKTVSTPVTITDPAKGHMNLIVSASSFQTIIYW